MIRKIRWNPSRDTIEGNPACAHCGMTFVSIESVRSHVTQGRCQAYDATRTSEPKPIDDRWIEVLNGGQFKRILHVSHSTTASHDTLSMLPLPLQQTSRFDVAFDELSLGIVACVGGDGTGHGWTSLSLGRLSMQSSNSRQALESCLYSIETVGHAVCTSL